MISACWLTLAACGASGRSASELGDAGESAPESAAEGDVPARDASSASASSPLASTPAPGDALPQVACSDRPPSAFTAQCAGCHRLGSASGGAPDLLAYKGSAAELKALVRSGRANMPAFASDALSDAALRSIGDYLAKPRGEGHSASGLGPVKPLFDAAPEGLPVQFVRDDGVLITRGAGRVRQRHELEGTFGPFGPLYFEGRTYGFVIEDYTPRGESRIRVTYLPLARPQDSTNFRCFKIYGNGNVFHANTGMDSDTPFPSLAHQGKDAASTYAKDVASFARTQQHEVTNNARTNNPLQKGDMFEFEFGIFIEPSAVSPNSRTAYYTDTFRYRVGLGGLTPENLDSSGKLGPNAHADLGGGTTVIWAYAEPETYFSQLALNVQHEHVQSFVEGRRLFHTDFGTGAHSEPGNPAFKEQANKLGPLYVARSCVSCHVGNGGGKTLGAALDEHASMAFKLYGATEAGRQLQLQEGTARALAAQTRDVMLGDGSKVTLSRPRFEVKSQSGSALQSSARVARRLIGLGLLEAVREESVIALADPEDCDGDGISGRPNLVPDPEGGALRLGRFGWRAEKVSVAHQVADALSEDLGVQSRIFPGAGSELSDADLARLTTYMRLVGVPPQRAYDDATVQQGEQLFQRVGCASCHAPQLTTGQTHPFVELRAQQIRPFTDLLLHDMGPDLADDSGQGEGASASASEWRTPPLWGVGVSKEVQGYVALLHDGRAQSVLEAVLWHGGEAEGVRQRFQALSATERDALVRFVESL